MKILKDNNLLKYKANKELAPYLELYESELDFTIKFDIALGYIEKFANIEEEFTFAIYKDITDLALELGRNQDFIYLTVRIAQHFYRKNKIEKAINLLEDALNFLSKTVSLEVKFNLLNTLGCIYSDKNESIISYSYYLEIREFISDEMPLQKMVFLVNLTRLFLKLDFKGNIKQCLSELDLLVRQFINEEGQIEIKNENLDTIAARNNIAFTILYSIIFREYLTVFSEKEFKSFDRKIATVENYLVGKNIPLLTAYLLLTKAYVNLHKKEFEVFDKHIVEADLIFEEIDVSKELGGTTMLKGLKAYLIGEYDKAIDYLIKLLKLDDNLNFKTDTIHQFGNFRLLIVFCEASKNIELLHKLCSSVIANFNKIDTQLFLVVFAFEQLEKHNLEYDKELFERCKMRFERVFSVFLKDKIVNPNLKKLT